MTSSHNDAPPSDPVRVGSARTSRAGRVAQSVGLTAIWRDRRGGAGLATGIAAVAAVVSSWWMPHGPLTGTHALATIMISALVGVAAGIVTRSRWSMLLAPAVFAAVLGRDASRQYRSGTALFAIDVGIFGLLVLVPMLLGAVFGAALARRARSARRARQGRAPVGLYARRTVVGATTIAMIVLAVGIVRPAGVEPFRDAEGGIVVGSLSEKIRVQINGMAQGMIIKSRSTKNPVLLFVHGGPGMPEYWLTQDHPTGLEDHFTVVWWDQRGAGLSYDPDIPPSIMSAAQMVADTLAVTRYLIQRFDQKKIYIMGHSWGSYIGIQAAAEAPELYRAYIGVGQITDQLESEQAAYAYALAYYADHADAAMLKKMKAAPPGASVPLPAGYFALRDQYMHGAGVGTMHAMTSVISGIFLPSWRFRQYTLMEKVNLWRGKMYSNQSRFGLWDTMLANDLRQKITALEIPVYFLHGKFDYTSAYPLAKVYLEQLKAPVKGFYTFDDSAHSPMFEEPERTIAIMLTDVVNGTASLADRE